MPPGGGLTDKPVVRADQTDILRAIVQGVVEGVTEFLPVSSTGHMRLVTHWMGEIVSPAFNSTFDIFIQVGAILAVVVYFRRKLLDVVGRPPADLRPGEHRLTPEQRRRTLFLIALGTAPLAVGLVPAKLADGFYEQHARLQTLVICGALFVGGVLMILIERFKPAPAIERMEEMTYRQALIIGFCQIIAGVFPGTSRSMATIMPALCLRISRPVAAEFSFFLAIPALSAAAGFKLVRFLANPDATLFMYLLLAIGTLTAFVVAYVVIAAFMGFIRKYSFTPFGVYRIILAIVVYLAIRGEA